MNDEDLTAESAALLERMRHGLALITADTPMHGHCTWECCAMLEALMPSDLTPAEMMGMAVILSGANSRRLSQRPAPVLRLAELGEALRGA